jgi:hypothetical protein
MLEATGRIHHWGLSIQQGVEEVEVAAGIQQGVVVGVVVVEWMMLIIQQEDQQ